MPEWFSFGSECAGHMFHLRNPRVLDFVAVAPNEKTIRLKKLLMRCDAESVGAVRGFCEAVSYTSTSDLRLLKTIEKVLDWLDDLRHKVEAEAAMAEKFRESIIACSPKSKIDPDDAIKEIIERSEKSLEQAIQVLQEKRLSAVNSTALQGENKDAVISEYSQTVDSFSALHDGLIELRWAIMEHDVSIEEMPGEIYSSAEKLIEHLKA